MKKKINIAIIEDEPIIARNLEMILTAQGYHVTEILYHKASVVDYLSVSKPDLVLLDLNLEGHFEGLEIAEQLQNNYHIPFIYITSYTDSHIIEKAKVYCPLGYIVKPFEAREIYANVEVALYIHSQKGHLKLSFDSLNAVLDSPLTKKEFEVMIALTKGQKYKELAKNLHITINTLNTHIKSIFSKLSIHSRSELGPFLRTFK